MLAARRGGCGFPAAGAGNAGVWVGRDGQSLTAPGATRAHLLAAVACSLLLVAVFTGTLPFARAPTQGTQVLLPAYAAAMFVLELITAALLFALYKVQRSRALLCLASGYLFSALMVPGWALTFPSVFAALGDPFDAFGLQTTAAIAAVRRIGFPLFVLCYALSPSPPTTSRPARGTVARSVFLVVALAGLATGGILANQQALPVFMRDGRIVSDLWQVVPLVAMGLYVASLAVLLVRRRTQLDIWVCLVLFSLIIELMLISYIGGARRLSVGWWAGRLYGLLAASIVLLVLLFETTAVYARLSRIIATERRARHNRLTAMEALSASIAHEINQPLASMVTNADAALRWLAKEEPRTDKANDALRRIVADGHRANKVVTGIRTMFMKGTQERAPVNLNALVANAVQVASGEARLEGIQIETVPDASLPEIIGNAVQLHQVLCNLIENAIDAIHAAGGRQRRLVIRTGRSDTGDVQVSVADTGTGIAPEVADRLFDPFVSSKPGGMGMGLMFCRSIIEAHGGRVWVSPNTPQGAIFHVSLPDAMFPSRFPSPAERDR
ncbi:MAG: hypothetical protein B7Z15_08500 [Rhizobiales bacterium 32-66-8]|nr:MAG: hypothetical protein B7Z15_08500 [Rhizobiales bacterium 32-66-8]